MFFDRAFLMLGNLLFIAGLFVLVGSKETFMSFARKIKGSLALAIGLTFIIIKWKFIGTIIQLYGIYQYFKGIALQFLSDFKWVPFIGPYIAKLRKGGIKKTDDANLV